MNCLINILVKDIKIDYVSNEIKAKIINIKTNSLHQFEYINKKIHFDGKKVNSEMEDFAFKFVEKYFKAFENGLIKEKEGFGSFLVKHFTEKKHDVQKNNDLIAEQLIISQDDEIITYFTGLFLVLYFLNPKKSKIDNTIKDTLEICISQEQLVNSIKIFDKTSNNSFAQIAYPLLFSIFFYVSFL